MGKKTLDEGHHPLKEWSSKFREAHQQTERSLLGMFIVSASSLISECCATTGIDWLAADMEASPATRHDLLHIAQSLNGSSVGLFARVAQNNQQYIEAALDVGVCGVIVPKVSNASQAREVVNASYYPPLGTRGMNPIRCSGYFCNAEAYIRKANENILCIAQIETKEAVENVKEIAAVSGISGLFIGCGDLAADYGMPGSFSTPQMQHAISTVLEACKEFGRVPGIFAYNEELAKEYIKKGYIMVAVGNEIKFLRACIESTLSNIKKLA